MKAKKKKIAAYFQLLIDVVIVSSLIRAELKEQERERKRRVERQNRNGVEQKVKERK